MTRFAVYGAEGFAREVMPLVRAQAPSPADESHQFVFVDDNPAFQGRVINGIVCLSFEELTSGDVIDTLVSVAIASPPIRAKLVEKCENAGLSFFNVVAGNHIRYDEVDVAEGAIFCGNTMITSNAKIGRHFHCNIYSYVAHDCVVGDFVTFAPRVSCNGRVVIEDFAYIGTGVVFKQGQHDKPLVVGRGATVGMGAVVTKDVPAGVIVVGNPAKELVRG